MTALLLVTTSCADSAQAEALAAYIIDMRLAACVQVTQVASHYIWEGQRQTAQEFKLEFKSLPALRAQIEAAISDAHSYELPEIVFMPVSASAAYAKWVKTAVKPML